MEGNGYFKGDLFVQSNDRCDAGKRVATFDQIPAVATVPEVVAMMESYDTGDDDMLFIANYIYDSTLDPYFYNQYCFETEADASAIFAAIEAGKHVTIKLNDNEVNGSTARSYAIDVPVYLTVTQYFPSRADSSDPPIIQEAELKFDEDGGNHGNLHVYNLNGTYISNGGKLRINIYSD